MTEAEIAEAFILAAEIERKMPRTGEKPAGYGGYALQWVRTYEDKLNWRKEIGDKLLRGDNPLTDEREAFWDGRSSKVQAEDVTLWEKCLSWTGDLLDNEKLRRALWAWAFSKAGGPSFSSWCRRVENVSRTTGLERKNKAVARIYAHLARSDVQNIEDGTFGGLQVGDENSDISANIEDGASECRNDAFWRADGAFGSFLTVGGEEDFSWSEKRNELRRKREAKRKKEAA